MYKGVIVVVAVVVIVVACSRHHIKHTSKHRFSVTERLQNQLPEILTIWIELSFDI